MNKKIPLAAKIAVFTAGAFLNEFAVIMFHHADRGIASDEMLVTWIGMGIVLALVVIFSCSGSVDELLSIRAAVCVVTTTAIFALYDWVVGHSNLGLHGFHESNLVSILPLSVFALLVATHAVIFRVSWIRAVGA